MKSGMKYLAAAAAATAVLVCAPAAHGAVSGKRHG